MATERLSMRHIREMLRQKWALGLSHRAVVGRPLPETISIEFLLECLAGGMTIPEIVEDYPTLTEEAIKGALEELAHSDRIAAP
jgi:hypothetical protein